MTSNHHDNDQVYIGTGYGSPFEGRRIPLDPVTRCQHVDIIGATGTGKSTLMRQMFLQDVYLGQGACFIDPHGVDARELLDYIPSARLDDVLYFDPSDKHYPIPFNPMHAMRGGEIDVAVDTITAALRSQFKDGGWGPRMEGIQKHSIGALFELDGGQHQTLLGIQRMLQDEKFRNWVLKFTKNPATRSFWFQSWANWSKREQSDNSQAVLNKIDVFLRSKAFRRVVGQPINTFDFEHYMKEQKIVIINLNSAQLGEDVSNLFGTLFISAIEHAGRRRLIQHMQIAADLSDQMVGQGTTAVEQAIAEARDAIPEFFVFVDEFSSLTTARFARILSELRKTKTAFTVAHQYTEQVDDQIMSAIFGNVGTFISFRVGSEDAPMIAKKLGSEFPEAHLTSMPDRTFTALTKDDDNVIAIRGQSETLPFERYGRARHIINRSRERYGNPGELVEAKVTHWLESKKFTNTKKPSKSKAGGTARISSKDARKKRKAAGMRAIGDVLMQ